MRCQSCGRPAENGRPTHWLGCEALARRAEPAQHESTREDGCFKDGCTNPRAVSKGPRPTKYCGEHKTGSKK